MVISGNITQPQLPVEQKVKTQPQVTEQKDKVEVGTHTEKPDFVLTPDQKKELKKLAQEMGINLDQEGIHLTEEQKKELTEKALSELNSAAKAGIAGISLLAGGFAGIRGFACGLIGLGAGAVGALVGVGGPVGVAVAAVAMGAYGLYRGLSNEKGIIQEFKDHYLSAFKTGPEHKVSKAIIRGLTDAAATATGGLLGPLGYGLVSPLITGTPAGIKTAVKMSEGLEYLQDAIIQELNKPEGQAAQNEIINSIETQINNQLKED